ncbi:uncharacterized protein ASCRUDRAFT_73907, partial [Ascoidea rubescens DSM 1968]
MPILSQLNLPAMPQGLVPAPDTVSLAFAAAWRLAPVSSGGRRFCFDSVLFLPCFCLIHVLGFQTLSQTKELQCADNDLERYSGIMSNQVWMLV